MSNYTSHVPPPCVYLVLPITIDRVCGVPRSPGRLLPLRWAAACTVGLTRGYTAHLEYELGASYNVHGVRNHLKRASMPPVYCCRAEGATRRYPCVDICVFTIEFLHVLGFARGRCPRVRRRLCGRRVYRE